MNYKILLVLTSLLFVVTLHGQLNPEPIEIPMRDGKTLAADLYHPDTKKRMPVILIQTPYNKGAFKLMGMPLGIKYNLQKSNFAFVIVDWRGYWGSKNAANLFSKKGQDGYDAIEWVAKQKWCDGKVGTWGPSALGSIQFMTAKERPPSLVCAMPVVTSPTTSYAKYFPGGALKLSYLKFVGQYYGTGKLVAANHVYNNIWKKVEEASTYPDKIHIPMFMVAGWFDHNIADCLNWIVALRNKSPAQIREKHKILIGPWTHNLVGQPTQGEMRFPEAQYFNHKLGLQFFDYHLRGINNGWEELKPYQFFQLWDNEWKASDSWVPGNTARKWFLQPDLTLLESAPNNSNEQLFFKYDPKDPSPSNKRQGPIDQSGHVESRNDHLIFTSPPLTTDLEVRGKIKIHLIVGSDKTDTDFVVRLTDVFPDGRSLSLREGIQRMRYLNGFSKSDVAFLSPGKSYPITIELDELATTFKRGHRIRLIITGSNYPLYQRNMNNGGDLFPDNEMDALVNPSVAENRIYFQGTNFSFVEIPAVGK